jgi:hypothetical protein
MPREAAGNVAAGSRIAAEAEKEELKLATDGARMNTDEMQIRPQILPICADKVTSA